MKLYFDESIELNEDDSKCFATLWTAYIDDEYKCACCGKKFPEGHGTVYLGGHKPDGMHFIYEYTKENRVGNNINYDPYNLPPEDETGGIFKVVVGEDVDDEGYNWLNFCRNCWPKLTDMSPDEIYTKYSKDTVTESSKLCESSENVKNYCFQRMIDYYGPEYDLTDEQIRKAAEMWYQKLVDTASYYPFGCVDLFGASEDTIEDAYDSGLLDEDEYDAFMNDNYPECFAEESINDVLGTNTVTEDFDDDYDDEDEYNEYEADECEGSVIIKVSGELANDFGASLLQELIEARLSGPITVYDVEIGNQFTTVYFEIDSNVDDYTVEDAEFEIEEAFEDILNGE